MTALPVDHRRPPDPPFFMAPGRRCHVCGAERPRNRTRYCSAACSDVMDYVWHPRWAAWKIATDLFGEGRPPRCFSCLRTAKEAALERGVGEFRVPGLELDHVRPLYSLTREEAGQLRWWLPFNLQLLCHWCHAAKSGDEARSRAWNARRKSWDATRERLGLLELLPGLPEERPAKPKPRELAGWR